MLLYDAGFAIACTSINLCLQTNKTQNCLHPSSMPLSAQGLFAATLVIKGCDVSSRDTMPAS